MREREIACKRRENEHWDAPVAAQLAGRARFELSAAAIEQHPGDR
jgi:hypothetical protein